MSRRRFGGKVFVPRTFGRLYVYTMATLHFLFTERSRIFGWGCTGLFQEVSIGLATHAFMGYNFGLLGLYEGRFTMTFGTLSIGASASVFRSYGRLYGQGFGFAWRLFLAIDLSFVSRFFTRFYMANGYLMFFVLLVDTSERDSFMENAGVFIEVVL